MANQKPRTQKTKPKHGDPIEIPVPKRKDVLSLFKRAAQDSGSGSRKKK